MTDPTGILHNLQKSDSAVSKLVGPSGIGTVAAHLSDSKQLYDRFSSSEDIHGSDSSSAIARLKSARAYAQRTLRYSFLDPP